MRGASILPARYPVGTKYILEGRGPFVHRYIEFPDGRRLQLGLRKAQEAEERRCSRSRLSQIT